MGLLKHSGLYSVQLQEPGAPDPVTPAAPVIPAKKPAVPVKKP
jgi:hypothetical protein